MKILSVACNTHLDKEKMFSQAAVSDCTDHKATPVMVSITPVLSDLMNEGKRRINSISDSPTPQHQNEKVFWSQFVFCLFFVWKQMLISNGYTLRVDTAKEHQMRWGQQSKKLCKTLFFTTHIQQSNI